ncbi:MAG: nucleotidyltransferase family protein [Desulfurococcales archaeon]|nr:nucleotidyltransferase family protein [Desulfurococcales archaeon]
MLVTAVILAAGKSTRFPGNKMLRRVRLAGVEAPIIRHTVRKFMESGVFDDVVVVVGHRKGEVMDAVGLPDVKYAVSLNYEVGMSESVKAGVSAVMRYSDAVAIHPGDVPFILKSTLRELVRVASEEFSSTDRFVVIPKYRPFMKGGHPLIIGRGLLPYVLEIGEETRGLKGFLARFRHLVRYVCTDDLGVLADVDTPEDLVRDEELMRREV